jgi:hypothetical protein
MDSGQASTPDKGQTPPAAAPEQASASDDEQVSAIKKGITMRVKLYIEGMDAPAHDFSKTGADVVNRLLAAGIKSATGSGYTVRVKKIEPLEGSDDEEEDADANAS